MGNIANFIDKIKHAVYGKDVRDSIAKGIQQCYDDAIANGHTDMEVVQARKTYSNLNARLDAENGNVNNAIQTEKNNRANADNNLQNQINSLASGSPLVASSVAEMTNTSKIYVNTSDGKWYYHNGSNWVVAGVYQASEIADNGVTYPKFNTTGFLPTYDTTEISNLFLTDDGNIKYDNSYGYYVYCIDVTGFYSQGITKIPISVRGGNLVRISRSSLTIEQISQITDYHNATSVVISSNKEEILDVELTELSKTIIIFIGRYRIPEIVLGKEITRLSRNIIKNENIEEKSVTSDKTNFAKKNDYLPISILHKVTLSYHDQANLYELTMNDNYHNDQTAYGIDVSQYVSIGKRSLIVTIKGENITFIRIARSSHTIDDVLNLQKYGGFGVSKIYDNSSISNYEYKIAIDLLPSTKMIVIYTGQNTTPEIEITNKQYSFINDKDNDWISISSYPKCDNDTSDSERIQRCFNENKEKTIFFPVGEYEIATTIEGENISMKCDNQAHFIGKTEHHFMFILTFNNPDHRHYSIEGGWFDGDYYSSCIKAQGGHNVMFRDCMFMNAWHYGLYIGTIQGIATSKYYIHNCTGRGTESNEIENILFCINGSDHHFVDNTGSNYYKFYEINASACRFERCHNWIIKESLIDKSIGFDINADACTFIGCYLDTLKTGFNINSNNCQFISCDGFNNTSYGMTNEIYFKKNRKSDKVLLIGGKIRSSTGTIISDETNVTKIAFNT